MHVTINDYCHPLMVSVSMFDFDDVIVVCVSYCFIFYLVPSIKAYLPQIVEDHLIKIYKYIL